MVLEVESFHARRYSSTVQGSGMGRLRRILSFPRLLEEFHTFCQKALCSESLVFLMEVLEFRRLLEINPDEDGQFSQFLSIANKFIKRDAPCEINIGSKSKAGQGRDFELLGQGQVQRARHGKMPYRPSRFL